MLMIRGRSFLFRCDDVSGEGDCEEDALYHCIGMFRYDGRPTNSARIAPDSARQRQESAKANIVIGGRAGRGMATRQGREGAREDREEIANKSEKRRPRIRDLRSLGARGAGSVPALSSFFGVISAGPLSAGGDLLAIKRSDKAAMFICGDRGVAEERERCAV